nr:DUF2285 domain-containing protein [Boseongicola sp. H5]
MPLSNAPAIKIPNIDQAAIRHEPSGTSVVSRASASSLRLLLLDSAEPGRPLAAIVPLDAFGLDRIEALSRLWRVLNHRPVPLYARLTEQRRRRLRLMLQAIDGHLSGATYREIAKALYGELRVDQEHWKTSPLRDSTIALVKDGRAMIAGGYLRLLRHRRRG